jgi:hypothetical protein
MAECAAAGLMPHLFWGYAPRETFALLKGAGIRAKLEQSYLESNAWKSAYFGRVKKLPTWDQVMRPFRPRKVMSRKSIRAAILGMAQAMGAHVIHRPRKPPKE